MKRKLIISKDLTKVKKIINMKNQLTWIIHEFG